MTNNQKQKIYIGADHAGFNLKKTIIKYLGAEKYEVIDLGTDTLGSVNYPLYGKKVAQAIDLKSNDLGIVICGSGIGISIAANKIPGIRCALVYIPELAELAREHNDANVLALAGRFTDAYTAKLIVKKFLNSKFDTVHPRHKLRVEQLNNL